ncbi:MAG: hypothetical protein LBS91_07320 [Clostridiales Family XIII bacterium]|jgi:hypothetical protein|nr:hypothetical protein [Clostridiales Family XIII bacterium]
MKKRNRNPYKNSSDSASKKAIGISLGGIQQNGAVVMGNSENAVKSDVEHINATWRFLQAYIGLLSQSDPYIRNKYQNQLEGYIRQFDRYYSGRGYQIVNLEGCPFEDGHQIEVLNTDIQNDEIFSSWKVAQMLEPIILYESNTVNVGKVILTGVERKIEEESNGAINVADDNAKAQIKGDQAE